MYGVLLQIYRAEFNLLSIPPTLKRMAQFDIVIPLGPKDEDMIDRCVSSIYRHVVGFRYVFIVAKNPRDISGALVLDETTFPFSYDEVLAKTSEKRAGWYLQQLIKLYAPLLITDILENVLTVDADTIFHKRTKFIESGKFLYDKTTETHAPYFEHMIRLHPSFTTWKRSTSGITNVMLLNKKILIELMEKVETLHRKNFWEAFLDTITEKNGAGASEFEIYFHYIMTNKPELVRLRPLQWSNWGQRADTKPAGDWNYVNYHHHQQRKPRTFA